MQFFFFAVNIILWLGMVKTALKLHEGKEEKPVISHVCSGSTWLGLYGNGKCAKTNRAKRRIFGGIPTTRSAFPWIVQLSVNGTLKCGGSLVDEMIVVTAAHCIEERYPRSWYQVSVRAPGKNESEMLGIEFVELHPLFKPGNGPVSKLGHDIAVLKLNHAPQTANPICLPTQHTPNITNTSHCYVAGWGKTEKDKVSPNGLRYAKVPVYGYSVCNKQWDNCLDETMMCAGNTSSGPCDGDSGGPLMCIVDDHWVLFGVVNFASFPHCLHLPAVFADIQYFLHWIMSNTQRFKDEIVNQMRRELVEKSLQLDRSGQALKHAIKSAASFKECSDIKSQIPDAESGEYKFRINGVLKSVHCDMDTQGGGWTVFQRRMDGSVNFTRNWLAYREGFGNFSGEHWIGNEALHYLTSLGDHDLLVEMREWKRTCTLYALYSNFSVANEDQEYRLSNIKFMEGTLPGYSGIGMSPHGGMPFTTVDRNANNSSRNCAREFHGGWWYTHYCYNVNLNGRYSDSPCVDNLGYINWLEVHSWYYSFPWTEIKFRRSESRKTGKDGRWCSKKTCAIQCKMDKNCGCNSNNSHCKSG